MIESLYSSFKAVLEMTWPTLFISMVLLVSVRASYLLKHKSEFVFYKEILLFFFAMYILCLFQVVTSQDINMSSGNNFVPFVEILRYKPWGRLFIKNIVGNVIMFVPYGFFVGKYSSGKSFLLTIFLIFLASFSIEVTQLAIGRVFDVDDIILNVLGGMLGYFVYVLLDNLYNCLPKIFRSSWFLNSVALLLLISVIMSIIFIMA